jgi:predicted Rossmann fold flavoprotein
LIWLQEHGLTPELRNDKQYFCKNSASEMMDIFKKYTKNQNILLNEKVLEVHKNNNIFSVKTTKRTIEANYVVVASGGLSFPKIGASSIGYTIASSFGHTVTKTAPALVGFTLQPEQFFFKELSGLSTEVAINIKGNICKGSLLFAHKGISGPAILDASIYWDKGLLEIDFLPNFSLDSLRKSKKQLTSLLPMPKRLTKSFLVQLGLNDKIGLKLSSEEVEKLKTLKHYSFAPAGTFGYSKAEVTKGGVSTNEIDAYTMQSKIEEGLFFLGEVLDVTGRLGGYNFQWAFSSAYMCANYLKEN